MDDQQMRGHISRHADAVVRGDMDAVLDDFSEDLHSQIPPAIPQPVTVAEVLSVDVGDKETTAMIRYLTDSGDITIRSRWRDEDGRPVIVHAERIRALRSRWAPLPGSPDGLPVRHLF